MFTHLSVFNNFCKCNLFTFQNVTQTRYCSWDCCLVIQYISNYFLTFPRSMHVDDYHIHEICAIIWIILDSDNEKLSSPLTTRSPSQINWWCVVIVLQTSVGHIWIRRRTGDFKFKAAATFLMLIFRYVLEGVLEYTSNRNVNANNRMKMVKRES